MNPLNERGHEVPDPTPMALPVGVKRPLSLREQIQRFVREELSAVSAQQGHETFEEADDFDIEDEDDGHKFASKWELSADQESYRPGTAERFNQDDGGDEPGGSERGGSVLPVSSDDGDAGSGGEAVSAPGEGGNPPVSAAPRGGKSKKPAPEMKK